MNNGERNLSQDEIDALLAQAAAGTSSAENSQEDPDPPTPNSDANVS